MTSEERISALANLRHVKRWKDKDGLADETIDICIKLLKQEPCDDCISRQAVLDHIYGINGLEGLELSNVFEKHYADFIKSLPPVTPQYTETEIQKMQELEQAEIQKAYELGKAEQPCEDAISRQAVLEAIRKCHCEEWIKADIGAPIEALPSVTPVEKVGHWIEERTYMECPKCHDIWHYEENQTERFKCCPNCGTKMQEVKE